MLQIIPSRKCGKKQNGGKYLQIISMIKDLHPEYIKYCNSIKSIFIIFNLKFSILLIFRGRGERERQGRIY